MVAFIDQYREDYCAEPICEHLPIALSTYRRCKCFERHPEKRSTRTRLDEQPLPEIYRLWEKSGRNYGARKVWKQLGLVQREFGADRPNQLWVADIIDVATWSGFVVVFVVDVFSRFYRRLVTSHPLNIKYCIINEPNQAKSRMTQLKLLSVNPGRFNFLVMSMS